MGCLKLHIESVPTLRLAYSKKGQKPIKKMGSYYPFGLKQKGYNNVNNDVIGNATAEKFGYNGVELEEFLGFDLYEMDLRQYDPAIARWTSIDPVTHHSMSTYTAFDNNPVYWADPSGADSIYNWDTGQYVINGQEVSQDEAIAYANSGGNSDGSNNNTPDDDITVNSKGIVTNVVKNDKPNRFFDEDGNELFFNDPENDFSEINEWGKGDRLFFNITNSEIINTIIREGGLEPLMQRYLNNIGAAWLTAAFNSHGGADFTFSHLVPTYFAKGEKSYLEEGILRTTYKSNQHFFKFGNTNNIYNLYDAGNYLWGNWMKFNGFSLGAIKFGSQVNELRKFSLDSSADQRAIENGFNHFKKK